MRLLVTRPEPDASVFAEELRVRGHDPVIEPLLEFHTLAFDKAALRNANAIVITSGNTLRAIEGAAKQIADIPVYCFGEETARRARTMGFQELLSIADTAEQLASRIIATARKGEPIIQLTGEHQAYDLAVALAQEGLSIQTLPVYSMEARRELSPSVDAMLRAGELDGVILMSPRTAGIYVSLCHRHAIGDCAKRPIYLCISENVAAKLASIEPNHVRVPMKPNRKALLNLLSAD